MNSFPGGFSPPLPRSGPLCRVPGISRAVVQQHRPFAIPCMGVSTDRCDWPSRMRSTRDAFIAPLSAPLSAPLRNQASRNRRMPAWSFPERGHAGYRSNGSARVAPENCPEVQLRRRINTPVSSDAGSSRFARFPARSVMRPRTRPIWAGSCRPSSSGSSAETR